MEEEKTGFTKYFSNIDDPRIERNKQHLLEDILVLTVLAVICGAESWESIEHYGNSKTEFLKTFLQLPNGIPSHDTIQRIFERIDPEQFRTGFVEFVSSICVKDRMDLINIDGKTLRHSFDSNTGKSAIHMVSAWSQSNKMVLGQFKVDDKSNEITAIPKLLDLLDIQESIITIDAMGCQKEIAGKIIEKKADYILALKGNQKYIREEVEETFKKRPYDKYNKTIEKEHGRVETRECFIINNMDWLFEKDNWAGIQSIIKIQSERWIKGKTEKENRYYISSLNEDAEFMNKAIRGHWGIENSLHWVLDVQFREDESRKRKGHSAENFAIIRHIALNLLKKNNTIRASIVSKRLIAAWDNDFLLNLFKI
jgi:predicted transposase YbfD/YdcC